MVGIACHLEKEGICKEFLYASHHQGRNIQRSSTGEDLFKEAMADQHWLAVGHKYLDEATSVGRSVNYGVLFKVVMGISGQIFTALIDSGASQCYIALDITALCKLNLEKETLHLELANGSKVQSMHKAPNVTLVVGKTVCKVDFTVTQLLFGVDLVLGIN